MYNNKAPVVIVHTSERQLENIHKLAKQPCLMIRLTEMQMYMYIHVLS